MEAKRSTAEEERALTPASSPASCEDVCSRREERDDFVGLMDENGVIGLLEALEVVGAVEYRVRKTQPDEAGYRRSDAAPGEDAHVFPPSPGEETPSAVGGASLSGWRYSDWSCQPSRTTSQCAAATASFKNTSNGPGRASRNPDAAAPNKPSHPTGCTPDYSKVKPRVKFPKVSYKPPRCRLRSKGDSPPFRLPAGAENVEEEEDSGVVPGVLPATPDSAGGRQEAASPREATRLLSELEENYNKLWIKYAEAENTIDHLRLAAKVNLYSDGPKPGRLVQPVYHQDASKFLTLNFPQAQRAEISSSPLPSDERGAPPNPPVPKEPGVTLYTQAGDFLQRLQTFEDLLKCQQLSPEEQRMELAQLFEGLRSLESSYLLAKDERKPLPKEDQNGRFDPDRELEGLIFDCALYMDELKEHAEQIRGDPLTREPSPGPAGSSSPSEGREHPTQPQKRRAPSLVRPPEGDASTLSSDGEEARRESNTLPDDHRNFREIPQALALSQENKSLLPTASETDMQPGGMEQDGPDQKIEKQAVKESPQQRNLSPEAFAHPYDRARLVAQPDTLDPSSRRGGFEMRTSHSCSLSSLGEIAATAGGRNSKLQAGSCRLPSQDGIVSPETDSGFIGTESCHPTPTEAPSPLHQGAMESVSVVQDKNQDPHTGLVASPDLFTLLPRRCPATELSTTTKFNTKQPRRTKPRKAQWRRTLTCAHQRWTEKSDQGTSGVEPSSSTVSEDGQTGRCSESAATLSPSSSCSSRRCHGDCTKLPRSTEAAANSVAMETLQAELSRLHHRLDDCLKERERSVAASETTVNHRHPRTSTPRVSSRKVNTDVTAAAVRKRPGCGHGCGHRPHVLGPSDRPQVSRCTQTASAPSDVCTSVHIKHRSVSVQAPEGSDEPDAEDLSFRPSLRLSPCLRCISRQQAGAEDSVPGSGKAALRSCGSHRCGSSDTDRHRFAHASTNTCHQAAETATCCAAPPPPLQCVCPLPLLLCSCPLYASPSNQEDTTPGLGSRKEPKSRRKRSPRANGQNLLDHSLNKAIRAAKSMESTSGRMSRSLRFGLHHHRQQQQLLLLTAQLSQRQASS